MERIANGAYFGVGQCRHARSSSPGDDIRARAGADLPVCYKMAVGYGKLCPPVLLEAVDTIVAVGTAVVDVVGSIVVLVVVATVAQVDKEARFCSSSRFYSRKAITLLLQR